MSYNCSLLRHICFNLASVHHGKVAHWAMLKTSKYCVPAGGIGYRNPTPPSPRHDQSLALAQQRVLKALELALGAVETQSPCAKSGCGSELSQPTCIFFFVLQTVERRSALPCQVLLWILRLIPDQPPAAPAPPCRPCLP